MVISCFSFLCPSFFVPVNSQWKPKQNSFCQQLFWGDCYKHSACRVYFYIHQRTKKTEGSRGGWVGPLSCPHKRKRWSLARVFLWCLIRGSRLVNCLADMVRGGGGGGEGGWGGEGDLIHDREWQVWRVSTDKTARVINRKREGWWEKGERWNRGRARERTAKQNKCHKIVLGSYNGFRKKGGKWRAGVEGQR